MADALLQYLRRSLPEEVAILVGSYVDRLEHGEYESLLRCPEAREIFEDQEDSRSNHSRLQDFPSWNDFIFHRLGVLLADRTKASNQELFFCIGYAAFLTFLQSNVTGPPLSFRSVDILLPQIVADSEREIKSLRTKLLESLGMDGISAYKLTPNVELLCLADAIFTCPAILKHVKAARWAKMRVAFVQQRLLSEVSPTLQEVIYGDLRLLEESFSHGGSDSGDQAGLQAEFLIERSTIHIHHGLDKLAQQDLAAAKQKHGFEYALTGLLGKRTKFQQSDVSQLVVLAKSTNANSTSDTGPQTNGHAKPSTIDLNDDTLLESISFSAAAKDAPKVIESDSLPSVLSSLDPSDQPQLDPLDSTILLGLASSITNTSPQDGITREETLPYAVRVLEGGSSNWQVYTQALLARSRIEGYKSRTVERGLLQLQAVVDQVIADTTENSTTVNGDISSGATSFLPQAKGGESAPASARLRYVFQLASPTRWDLEAELASRWVQLGGLRSALDIYERLEMWAEAALCWAATEREDKARSMIRRQLFHTSHGRSEENVDDSEQWTGSPRVPAPMDAPRLYCILGDLDQSPEMYEKAWEVSKHSYSRAQRSLGRHYFAEKDFLKAADAYSKSLKSNQLNHTSWFAMGCALLELAEFRRAVEAFTRCVQLDETDAESWSNLAAALIRKEPEITNHNQNPAARLDDEDEHSTGRTSDTKDRQDSLQKNRHDALNALRRAATLKHDSHRIWENMLIVATSLSPPDYASMLAAHRRIVELRGPTEGEKCVDTEIVELLVQHAISLSDEYDSSRPGLQRMVVRFIDESVVPLVTGSPKLWRLIARLALWRKKPASALDAEEKAWRVITSQLGWETESEIRWNEVVEATLRLCDSYESLGPMERTEGLSSGEPVAKDWRFKARSAVRGILGRGKGSWDGTAGWEKLRNAADELRG